MPSLPHLSTGAHAGPERGMRPVLRPSRWHPVPVVAQAGRLPPEPQAPDWAYPGTATRTQVPPPPDFRRAGTHYKIPLGIFEGQSDIGTAVVPGSASFEAATGKYTITSAGYNIWYYRDEFRFLWKRMSGDVSLAADIAYPDPNGYGDRKAVLVIRQDLEDDSPQVVVAPHGAGMIQLAQRPTRGAGDGHRVPRRQPRRPPRRQHPRQPGRHHGEARRPREARRQLYAVRQPGRRADAPVRGPITQKIDAPFYVGIGFCSHLPDTATPPWCRTSCSRTPPARSADATHRPPSLHVAHRRRRRRPGAAEGPRLRLALQQTGLKDVFKDDFLIGTAVTAAPSTIRRRRWRGWSPASSTRSPRPT